MAEGRGGAPPLLMALALLSAPPGGAFAPRGRAGLFASPGELSKSAENRVFKIGRSVGLEHRMALRRPLQWHTEVENYDIEDGSSDLESVVTAPRVSPPPHYRRHQKSLADDWGGRSDSQGYGPTPESPSAPSPSLAPLAASSASSGPRRRLRAHEACYSSNEVLLVIGVTCAVNFAFILLVVSLVHLCNRGASKTIHITSECEWRSSPAEELRREGRGWPGGAYERVQEYVDSLPDPHGHAPCEEDEAAPGPPRPRRRSGPDPLRGASSMEELLFRD